MTHATPTVTRAGRREWLGLAVLVLPTLLVSMDLSVLFFALPVLSADLGPTGSQALWILDIYGFVLAGLLITMGALGDRVGRRRLLMAGALVFGTASVIAAYSSSAELLIAARALLGVAGATLAPSTLSLIRNMFRDPGQRRAAIGVWTAGFTGGSALGPVLGGILLEHFWWGSVFLVNVPVMVLLLALAPLLLPESRDPDASRLDVLSAALSLAAVLPVVWGLKSLAEERAVSPVPLVAVAVGLAVGAWFAARQRRLPDPLIDVRLFASPAFSASIAVMMAVIFAMVGLGMMSAQYLQAVVGLTPLVAALWSLPAGLVMPAGIAAATVAVRRVRPAVVVTGGLAVAAAGLAIVARAGADGGLAAVVVGSAVMGLGAGGVMSLSTDMVMATAPARRAGAASATSETANELGGALGIAVMGSIGAATYAGRMERSGLLASLPSEAGQTVGAAVAIARELPGATGTALADTARAAFTAGFNLTALTGAALLALTAVGALLALRRVRLADAGSAEPAGAPPAPAADAEV